MNEFVEYLHAVFQTFGTIHARRMFGGYGIYHDGLMFALVADDTLFLKADAVSAAQFESRGLGRFGYEKAGKTIMMSYYQAPAEIFDDLDAARCWASLAYDAALRASKGS